MSPLKPVSFSAPRKEKKPSAVKSQITDHLDLMRTAINEVERFLDKSEISEADLTDLGARLTTNKSHLEKLSQDINNKIKASLISDNRTISEGEHFLGVLSKVLVERLITVKVRQFLGRRLGDFVTHNEETRLNYKPKG